MRSRDTLRSLLRVGAPPWGRLALALSLAVAGGWATVGLLAGSGAVVAKAAFRPGLGAIAGLLAAVEVLAVIRAPLRYRERLVGHDAAFRTLGRWRVWLYDHLEPLSPAGLRAWRSGDLLTRAVQDVDTLQDLYLRTLIPIGVAVATGALAVVIALVLLPSAAAVLAAALFVALVGPTLLGLGIGGGDTEAHRRGEQAADIVDLLQGSAELLAYGRAGDLLDRVGEVDHRLARWARRRSLASATGGALVLLCLGAAVVAEMVLAVPAVSDGRLEPIMLAVLPLITIGTFETVPPVLQAVLRYREVLEAGERLMAVAGQEPPVRDPAHPGTVPPGPLDVAFTGARLRYRPDLPLALDDVDLVAAPGSATAVVGPSGSGKSSLVNVLLRFWPLESGTAALGGVPVDHLRQDDVRRTIGLVDQEADLFAGTIRENITLGRPDADDLAIATATRLAQLDEWLTSLPDGLDTTVGEHGQRVSGGQRQRIALARALLMEAPILVLDEATAGLDASMGDRLMDDVTAATAQRCLLAITHDLRRLDRFDQVVTLDRGRVVARPGPGESPGGPKNQPSPPATGAGGNPTEVPSRPDS